MPVILLTELDGNFGSIGSIVITGRNRIILGFILDCCAIAVFGGVGGIV